MEAVDAEQQEALRELQTLSYLAGSRTAPVRQDVTIHEPKLAFEGLNFYVSGHAPEAVLMTMEGRVLHRWRKRFDDVWPDSPLVKDNLDEFWRRAHLLPTGDILAIFEGIGLIRLDKDSRLVWASQNGSHHGLFVADDGTIFVLTREAKILPRYHETKPILEDFISVLSADGQELRRVSVLEAFENSNYAPVLRGMAKHGDVFHTNSIEVLDGSLADRSPAFRRGNVLISLAHLDLVAVIDLDAQKVVWTMSGLWQFQHEPTILANGNMLILDNSGLGRRSRVLEIDPITQALHWDYSGTEREPLYTASCGTAARLPNGNTLITESDAGRSLELTADRRIVWEFINPHRAGEENELIATLFEVVRLPPDFPVSWAGRNARE